MRHPERSSKSQALMAFPAPIITSLAAASVALDVGYDMLHICLWVLVHQVPYEWFIDGWLFSPPSHMGIDFDVLIHPHLVNPSADSTCR